MPREEELPPVQLLHTRPTGDSGNQAPPQLIPLTSLSLFSPSPQIPPTAAPLAMGGQGPSPSPSFSAPRLPLRLTADLSLGPPSVGSD